MAPEYPPLLVVLDLYFEGARLLGKVEYLEAPAGQHLRVRWTADSRPQGFLSIGRGVVYVQEAEDILTVDSGQVALSTLADGRFFWREGLGPREHLMLVLILPAGYTVSEMEPTPLAAKPFEERIALYWVFQGADHRRADTAWRLQQIEGSLEAEVTKINSQPPTTAPIQVGRLGEGGQPVSLIYIQGDVHSGAAVGPGASVKARNIAGEDIAAGGS